MILISLIALAFLFYGIYLACNNDDVGAIFAMIGVVIIGVGLIVSVITIDVCAEESCYQVVCENGKLKNVETSKYGLKVINRRYYLTFKSGCVEYILYDNFGNRLFVCYSKDEVIRFFEPTRNDDLFGE